jgi:hypothetical protein
VTGRAASVDFHLPSSIIFYGFTIAFGG